MTKNNPTFIIDQIENGIAACEAIDTGARREISAALLPEAAKEGDIIREVSENIFVIDHAASKQRLAELTQRMNRLLRRR